MTLDAAYSAAHVRRSRAECTRDAVFLFQVRRVNAVCEPDGYVYDDGLLYPAVLDVDPKGERVRLVPDPDAAAGLDTDAQLALQASGKVDPFIAEWWETERVFLDRDEAEAWERANAHNYSGRGKAWRVYAVPAEGALAALLRGQDAVFPRSAGESEVMA